MFVFGISLHFLEEIHTPLRESDEYDYLYIIEAAIKLSDGSEEKYIFSCSEGGKLIYSIAPYVTKW
jgi:hypothetical protein